MSSTTPSPQTWTLRFKNNRTTILLHIDPLQSLNTIKSELLKAIQQTHPDGQLNTYLIPQNSNDILLAKPLDINDLTLGWQPLEPATTADDLDTNTGKGKGKAPAAAKKSAATGKNAAKDSAQGVGLRDGGVVAFKFRSEEDERDVEIGSDDLDVMVEEFDRKKLVWDVVVPTLEDTYGEGLAGVEPPLEEGEG